MYTEELKKITIENTNFRTVLETGSYSQLVVMNIPVGSDIGKEVHQNTDQFLYIVSGEAETEIDDVTQTVRADDCVFVHAGQVHNIKNTGDESLKLFTIYAPPEHKDGTIHTTKEEAMKDEHHE